MDVRLDSFHPNSQYCFNSPRQQYFSLQLDTILYILNNCNSPDVFQKLQKTCKYFYQKKNIAVIDEPVFNFIFIEWNGKKEKFYFEKNGKIKKHLKISVKKIYWLTNSLLVRTEMKSNYLESLYRCNLKSLKLDNQTLNFDEISFLLNGKNIEKLEIDLCIIRNNNGSSVTIDAILAQCPKIINLNYMNVPDNFTEATMKKLNSLNFINKFERFSFGIFEFENGKYEEARELLCQFIRKNVKQNKEPLPRIYILLLEGLYDYRIEFRDYINQNLEGWDICTSNYASGNSRREADSIK